MTLHLPCPSCKAVNRIAKQRLSDNPKCGQCAKPLISDVPIELSAENFSRVTGKSDLPVVVDFWAPWCGPCNMMAPAYEQAARELNTQAVFAKLNTENEASLSTQFNVRSIPTIIIFKHGNEIARQAGALDASNLHRFIEPHLSL